MTLVECISQNQQRIVEAVNDFRRDNGVRPIDYFDAELARDCLFHSRHMVKEKHTYNLNCIHEGLIREITVSHSDWLKYGIGECIAVAYRPDISIENQIRNIIFEGFGKSRRGHRENILYCSVLGGDICMPAPGWMYMTLRMRC